MKELIGYFNDILPYRELFYTIVANICVFLSLIIIFGMYNDILNKNIDILSNAVFFTFVYIGFSIGDEIWGIDYYFDNKK